MSRLLEKIKRKRACGLAKNENLEPATAINSGSTIPVLDISLQSKLVRLAIHAGIFEHGYQLNENEIAKLVPPSDWRDASNCTTDELKAWAACLALRAVRYRGKVPSGWDKISQCAQCGPVWSDHGLDTLSCGWCEMRMSGKWFPRP